MDPSKTVMVESVLITLRKSTVIRQEYATWKLIIFFQSLYEGSGYVIHLNELIIPGGA